LVGQILALVNHVFIKLRAGCLAILIGISGCFFNSAAFGAFGCGFFHLFRDYGL